MNVLVFYTPFFGYEKEIMAELERMGHNATLVSPRAFKSSVGRAIYRFFPKLLTPINNKYYRDIIRSYNEQQFDVLLSNDRIPIFALKMLKENNPNIRRVLYCDDSVENLKHIDETFGEYERVITFDKGDSKKYKIDFYPLYFRKEYAAPNIGDKYDYALSFVGTCHSDRYAVIKEIKKCCEEMKLQTLFYCYIQSKWVYYLYKITKKEFRDTKVSDFQFEKLSAEESSRIFHNSRCILDIQHPKQTGLTMRTIETIGARKKLITTNSDVKSYEFFDSRNICSISREKPVLPKCFFEDSYHENGFNTDKYSLENWLKYVLEI